MFFLFSIQDNAFKRHLQLAAHWRIGGEQKNSSSPYGQSFTELQILLVLTHWIDLWHLNWPAQDCLVMLVEQCLYYYLVLYTMFKGSCDTFVITITAVLTEEDCTVGMISTQSSFIFTDLHESKLVNWILWPRISIAICIIHRLQSH